jgi:UDP-N-acetylglucosamine 2-epimerase
MRPNQMLTSLTARALEKIGSVLGDLHPDWVVVQGDTTTAMACALAAFYQKIKVAHLEAGLRTNDIYSPFPEEINRRIISQIAALQWAPTKDAARSLRRESLPVPPARLLVTGNTVIDALLLASARVRSSPRPDPDSARVAAHLAGGPNRLFVLVTGHRRESFGAPLRAICAALLAVARSDRDTIFVYPVHPNPNVRGPVEKLLGGISNILLTAPKNYPEFIQLLGRSDVIVTDSGGVQEEAPSLGKTVLVTREVTERPEGLRTGLVQLVGHNERRLTAALRAALAARRRGTGRRRAVFPYGDGRAAARCVASLLGRPVKPFAS